MFCFKSQDEEDRCRIHSVSPYGCSHFDAHQTKEEADLRSSAGHYQVDRAWKNDDLYARLWLLLNALGRVAPSPVAAHARMRAAIKAQNSSSFTRAKTNGGDNDE
jgi:Fe-S-cluster containining protein